MRLVEIERASSTHLADAARLLSANDREALGPAEPPRPPAALADWLDPPGSRRRLALLAYEDGVAVGVATMQLRRGGGDDQLAWVRELFVAPAARRSGIGTALVGALRSIAAEDHRSFLALRHVINHEPARRFGDHLGARYAMTVEQQRVAAATLDRARLQRWIRQVSERGADYDLVAWDDRCPAEHIERFAIAQGIMNDAPRPESTVDWVVSPDEIRAVEATHAHNGTTHWIVVVRHRVSGAFAGYTEMTFDRHERWIAHQGDTGVDAAHRERGLGRWLKAHNLVRLLDERPEVTHVETANAGGNEPMLRINAELGFARVAEWHDREYWF